MIVSGPVSKLTWEAAVVAVNVGDGGPPSVELDALLIVRARTAELERRPNMWWEGFNRGLKVYSRSKYSK